MEKSKPKVNFDTLQFRPVRQSNSDIIATISSNGQQLQVVILILFDLHHPDIATSYQNFGKVYCNQSKIDKALEMYQKSLNIRLDLFNSNHPDIAALYNSIGDLYNQQSQYDQALETYQIAANIYLDIPGDQSLKISTIYNHIENICRKQGKDDQAVFMFQKPIDIINEKYQHNDGIELMDDPLKQANNNSQGIAYKEVAYFISP